MEGKIRCQSCGMPLAEEFGNLGTNADGSPTTQFCTICFAGGHFTNPDQTLEEIIQSSVENMTADLKMPREKAAELAHCFIPPLGRWRPKS